MIELFAPPPTHCANASIGLPLALGPHPVAAKAADLSAPLAKPAPVRTPYWRVAKCPRRTRAPSGRYEFHPGAAAARGRPTHATASACPTGPAANRAPHPPTQAPRFLPAAAG